MSDDPIGEAVNEWLTEATASDLRERIRTLEAALAAQCEVNGRLQGELGVKGQLLHQKEAEIERLQEIIGAPSGYLVVSKDRWAAREKLREALEHFAAVRIMRYRRDDRRGFFPDLVVHQPTLDNHDLGAPCPVCDVLPPDLPVWGR